VTLVADREEILRSLQLLVAPGNVCEVRAIKTKRGTISGYYNELATAASDVASISNDLRAAAPAVFVTLNPVLPDLLARAANQANAFAEVTTQDTEIVHRIWLLIDCDPVRPSGISASEEEHVAALARAATIRDWLTEQGWPMPVSADSGNGGHLLYRIDLPNDDDATSLIKRVLQALASRFDDEVVTVDQSTFNPSRVCKIYGTVARKGSSTSTRPHRLAHTLWNGQAAFEVVTEAQLEAIAAEVPPDEIKPRPLHATQSENVPELLAAWGLTIKKTEAHQGQEEAGTMHTLDACPFDDSHKDSAVFEYHASGRTVFKCLHTSCQNRGWKELRAKFEPWRQALIRNEKGAPRPLLANAIAMLENDPAFTGVLAFDEFALMTIVQCPTPWPGAVGRAWTDFDDSQGCAFLQSKGLHVGTQTTAEAIQVLARKNPIHPLRNYLQSLQWDGKPRLDTWIHDYMGAPLNAYTRAIGPRWMISAIARIYQPGVQADCALVALADQGKLKSTAFRTLAVRDPWFSDSIDTLGDRDSRERLRGLWIVELSELSALRRSELEHVKSFLSCRVDHYRPAYGRRSIDVPRSCVFCGTSNDESPFVDATGNRRFWPVRTGRIDLATLTRDRNLLWAEALTRYLANEKWWIDSEELEEAVTREQEEAFEGNATDELILSWCARPVPRTYSENGLPVTVEPFDSSPQRVTITDVLLHALAKPRYAINQADRYLVRNCLRHAGWTRSPQTKLPGNRNVRYYVAPPPKMRKLGEE